MNRQKRAKRTRAGLRGRRPRLSVFVSGKHIWAQIIDDIKGQTVVAASDREVGVGKTVEVARKIGLTLAKKAEEKKVNMVVFDRGGRRYHGRIKALAEGAREGGLKF